MNAKLILAMKRMGYRHMGKNIWGKPVAYHLFVIRHKGKAVKFINYFLGAQKQMLVWNTYDIVDAVDRGSSYELSIKAAECATETGMCTPGANISDFGFITKEELFADML